MKRMLKKINLTVMLAFLSGLIIAQPKVDSLKNKLKYCNVDTKIEICFQLDSLYVHKSQDTVIKYANYGLSLIDDKHISNRKNDFIRYIGMSYYYQNNFKSALKYLQQAFDGYQTENNVRNQIITINNIGVLYGRFSNNDKALSCFQQSLILSNKLKDTFGICVSLTHIGLVYKIIKDYKTALSNFDKALVLSTKLNDKLNIAHTLSEMSNTYNMMKNYKMALKYQEKALSICKDINEKSGIAHILADIGETYKKLNNMNMALKYYEDAYLISKELNDEYLNSEISSSIGDIYILMKNYEKAKEYLNNAESIARKIGNKETLKDVYESFSKYYSQKNDYKNALESYKRFKEMNDSIFSKEISDKITELQIKFDVQEKENENEILRQKNEIQQLAIHKQIYLRNTFIYISIIITLLVIFVIYRYWLKQRANKILTEKNEFINKQKDELEEVYKTKDKLFAVITHDLKNPISSVVTLSRFVETNYNTMEDGVKYKSIQSIKSSTANVYALLENLSDWLNSKRNNMITNKTIFDLSSSIYSVINLYGIKAEQKSIYLQTNVDRDINVMGDERMIKIILRNLLDNATKFTPPSGEIKIKTIENKDKIIVSISDTGIGIDEEDKNKLFDIESHFTTKGTQNETGGGLGLILCKEFIEKNDGEIWFESEHGKGSTFYFSLLKQ